MVEHGLLDDLVGSDQQRLRDGEAQSLRRLQIDQELEFSWLLYGKVSGLRTFQNSIHVVRCALVYGRKACPVGNEASGLNKVLVQRDHGQPVLCRQIEGLNPVLREPYILEDDQRFGAILGCSLKCAGEIARSSHGKA